jgi:hypothetical protein
MAATRKPVNKREVEIIKRLKSVIKLPVTKIALAVGRHKKTVYRCLQKKFKQLPKGRPQKLKAKEVSKLIKVMKQLVQKANGEKEVTLTMIRRRARCKFSESTIRRSLKTRNVKFRKLRSKPVLTRSDKLKRFRFAKKYKNKSRAWWRTHIQLHIDNKNFPICGNSKGRSYAAQRSVRGAYRGASGGLGVGYVACVVEGDLSEEGWVGGGLWWFVPTWEFVPNFLSSLVLTRHARRPL